LNDFDKKMKLFAFNIDFDLVDWIIGGEAKIRIAICDHIQHPNPYSSPIPPKNSTTNPKSPSVPHHFSIRVELSEKKRKKERKEKK